MNYLQQRSILSVGVGVWQSYCVSDTGYIYEGHYILRMSRQMTGISIRIWWHHLLLISPEDHSF